MKTRERLSFSDAFLFEVQEKINSCFSQRSSTTGRRHLLYCVQTQIETVLAEVVVKRPEAIERDWYVTLFDALGFVTDSTRSIGVNLVAVRRAQDAINRLLGMPIIS